MNSFTISALVLLSTLNMVMPLFYDARDSSNAFRDSRSTHVTFVKAPDGKCYRRVVTNDNGKKHVEKQEVDCDEAERQMKAKQERTQHKIDKEFSKVHEDIQKTQKSIEDQIKEFSKVHEDIQKTQKSIEDQIKQSMDSFDLDF